MSMQQKLQTKLTQALKPLQIEIINESQQHAGPKNAETHFRLRLVSAEFSGKSLVERHQLVYGLVQAELAGGVHALALETKTPEEWKQNPGRSESPLCAKSSKA